MIVTILFQLFTKFWTNASGAIWWPNLEPIQVVPMKSWKIYSRYGVNTLGPLCLWQCFFKQFLKQSKGFVTFETLITILTIENLNSCNSCDVFFYLQSVFSINIDANFTKMWQLIFVHVFSFKMHFAFCVRRNVWWPNFFWSRILQWVIFNSFIWPADTWEQWG